jgi:hypothetical protein
VLVLACWPVGTSAQRTISAGSPAAPPVAVRFGHRTIRCRGEEPKTFTLSQCVDPRMAQTVISAEEAWEDYRTLRAVASAEGNIGDPARLVEGGFLVERRGRLSLTPAGMRAVTLLDEHVGVARTAMRGADTRQTRAAVVAAVATVMRRLHSERAAGAI